MLNAAAHKLMFTLLLLAAAALVCAATASGAGARSDGETPAETSISNRADASYLDEDGTVFATVSAIVTVTVRPVSGVVVTPDETAPSATVAPQERVTRLFRVCNPGNTADLYTLTRAEVSAPAALSALYFDLDDSGTVTPGDAPATIGVTLSPGLEPRACVGVLAIVDTNASVPGSRLTIQLTARSSVTLTANGLVSDNGEIINTVGERARLTDPDNAALPPQKLVEGGAQVVAAPGQTLNYTIRFRNSGQVPARRVVLADDLPNGLDYIPGSLRLGNRVLTDESDSDEGQSTNSARRLEVRLAEVAVGALVEVHFRARVGAQLGTGAGIINTALITGDNLDSTVTSAAIAIINPFGTVYAGRSGGGVTIGGARVAVLTGPGADALPFNTAPGIGFAPNDANANPFITQASGRFSFAFAPAQLDAANPNAAPVTYYLNVTAPGYRARMLAFTVQPTARGLYTATVRALDGQPVARANSFALTETDVRLENLAGVALNIPLFEAQTLELTKSADQQRAEIGDIVSYRLELRNTTLSPLRDLVVRDVLPPSFHYAARTATLQAPPAPTRPFEPEVQGSELVFHLDALGANAHATITYRVRVGANAREGDQVNSATASGAFPSGEQVTTNPARATVRVGAGMFSTRQVIIGRVFADRNHNDKFDAGEQAVAGARLYLDNGQSVVTDDHGLYSLPSVENGAVVVALDPVTLPRGYALADDGRRAGRSWTRLLRTPLGGGTLLRQNFALRRAGDVDNDDDATDTTADKVRPDAPLRRGVDAPTNNHAPANTAPSAPSASAAANATPRAGTYEVEATEEVAPVAPGAVQFVSPQADEVILSPALEVAVRVHGEWTAQLEVNGERFGEANIGERRLDHKHNVATFTFVGLSLRPGQNRVRATALGPDGQPGKSSELIVLGRGSVRRLEIAPARAELQADGRDETLVRVRGFDQWNHPAADSQVSVATSNGHLLLLVNEADSGTATSANAAHHAADAQDTHAAHDANQTGGVDHSVEGIGAATLIRQQLLNLRGGEAIVRLVADNAAGLAEVQAQTGDIYAKGQVRFTAELRPAILVGLAEASVGRSAPENNLRGTNDKFRSHVELFYRGSLFGTSLLTFAYDSQRSLNRTAGRDRLFAFDPTDRVYPIFGDTSTRYEDVQANSKLYARVDHRRSYAMFGDFESDMSDSQLAGYARKLTGGKIHVENAAGDFISLGGARPDTAFARDVFPAGQLGLIRLSHPDVLQGSETVVLEVRDRRNPERILSREPLQRSLDYNLDLATGQLFFLRPISAFDFDLNLVQLVATYEHRADGLSSNVYTGRASKQFTGLGLRLGLSYVQQQQNQFGNYRLGGFDGEQQLPHRGTLRFEYANSHGDLATAGNLSGNAEQHAGGSAYRAELTQPLNFLQGQLRAEYERADEGFFNPFGQTVTPGARRAAVALDLKPGARRTLHFAAMDERNRTANVNNSRQTLSFLWNESIGERINLFAGFDHRRLSDHAEGGRDLDSNLLSVGAQVRPIDKLELSIKREQNLGDADPTYPDQTTLAARYRVNGSTNLFFTQRLAAAPIVPISDVSATGFAGTSSRRETAIGVETKLGRYTNLTSRYQLDSGINGTDSFAVVGLQNRLPVSQQFFFDFGFERGFHLAGAGQSFTGGAVAVSYLPTKNLRTSARYELRAQQGGAGQLFTVGVAGRVGDGITTLARFQMSHANFGERRSDSNIGTAALALRPLKSDRAALLFSYTHRSFVQSGEGAFALNRERSDQLSTDGLWQPFARTELFGHVAVKFGGNSREGLTSAAALTYIAQMRAQQRLRRAFDVAAEYRILDQPSSQTRRQSIGAELGFWPLPDVRLAFGYNLTAAQEPVGSPLVAQPRGYYFALSTKLSNLFNLFGTAADGLAEKLNTTTGKATAAPLPPDEKR